MAYTKTTWVDGDLITAEKLNHIEDGIANSQVIFHATVRNDVTTSSYTVENTDMTLAELSDAFDNGTLVGAKVEINSYAGNQMVGKGVKFLRTVRAAYTSSGDTLSEITFSDVTHAMNNNFCFVNSLYAFSSGSFSFDSHRFDLS